MTSFPAELTITCSSEEQVQQLKELFIDKIDSSDILEFENSGFWLDAYEGMFEDWSDKLEIRSETKCELDESNIEDFFEEVKDIAADIDVEIKHIKLVFDTDAGIRVYISNLPDSAVDGAAECYEDEDPGVLKNSVWVFWSEENDENIICEINDIIDEGTFVDASDSIDFEYI
jgi:hypothetical protein